LNVLLNGHELKASDMMMIDQQGVISPRLAKAQLTPGGQEYACGAFTSGG
jgi:hypothetical protein